MGRRNVVRVLYGGGSVIGTETTTRYAVKRAFLLASRLAGRTFSVHTITQQRHFVFAVDLCVFVIIVGYGGDNLVITANINIKPVHGVACHVVALRPALGPDY